MAFHLSGKVYYVSPVGSDINTGTKESPWLTIDKAANKMQPGDTLFLLDGVYFQTVDISVQGTLDQPITIASYPGDNAIVDGDKNEDGSPDMPKRSGNEGWTDPRYGNTFYWNGLVQFVDWEGQPCKHVIFRGIEVRNSAGRGISMHPGAKDITIEDCYVHHIWHTPVHMEGVTRPIVRNTVIHDGSNFAPYPRNYSEIDWPGNVQFRDVIDGLADGLTVYNCWGEGVLIGHSDGVILQNSVIYDNFALNVYTSHASNFIIRNNLIYGTGTAPFLRGDKPCSNLIIADEYKPGEPNGTGQTVVNNLIMGGSRNLGFWDFTWQGNENSGLIDAVIANNTLLDAVTYGIEINEGVHDNAKVYNNVIANPNTDAPLANVTNDSELMFDYNLWDEKPEGAASGPNDVINARLGLSQSGSIGPGKLRASYFDVTDEFAGINAGTVNAGVDKDFNGTTRDSLPDIGAIEYTGQPMHVNKQSSKETIHIYPNPATNKIHLQMENQHEKRWIYVFDAQGKICASDVGKGDATFQIEDFSAGMYTILIVDRLSKASVKFIKQE
jgi:hypothetical protein